MIFFHRDLQDGIQDTSGWTRSATRKLHRNIRLYRKYFALIRPFLPPSAIAFAIISFHDCEVVRSYWKQGKFVLTLDTQHEEMPFPERYVQLTFTAVLNPPVRQPNKGELWNLDEFHLGVRSKFVLHVLFTYTDIEISADEIRFKFTNKLN